MTGAAAGAPLVAVAPTKYVRGVRGADDDWRAPNDRGVVAAYDVLELGDALARAYPTDAHLVAYVVRDGVGAPLARQPRLNKASLPWVLGQGFRVDVGVLFCDVDNPGHAPWTPELEQAALAEWDVVPDLATVGIYHTAKGRRFVQPLDAPVPPEEAEALLRAWLERLETAGLVVDQSCKDWTRHFRLPHVVRERRPSRAPFVDLGRMRAVRLEAPPPLEASAPKASRAAGRARRAPRPPPSEAAVLPLGEALGPVVEHVAPAVRAEPGAWHALFLALAGALLERGAAPSGVPSLCVAISLATGADTRTDDRRRAAESTVVRAQAGHPFAGSTALVAGWPSVALALDRAFPSAPAASPANEAPPARGPSPVELAAQIGEAIRSAGPGLTVVQAPCGLGKTRAAERVALERSRKPYASADAKGERAPLGSRTSLSFDKNALSRESYERLRATLTPVERRFGALSVEDEQGRAACAHAAHARPLVEGRQSLARELCEGRGIRRCDYYEGCEARERREGSPDARIVLGPHALLGELDEVAGSTGLLVIDEPPSLLETEAIEAGVLRGALDRLGDFEPRYAAIVRPIGVALAAYLEGSPKGEGHPMRAGEALAALAPHAPAGLLDTACRAADVPRTGDDALDLGRALAVAVEPGRPPNTPPLLFSSVALAGRRLTFSDQLGRASGVFAALHRLFAGHTPGLLRVRRRRDTPRALVTMPRLDLALALQRDGAVVALDANADVHLPVYAKIVGYAPRHVRLADAPDGAPVERAILPARATRKRWMPGGKLAPSPELASAVRAVVDWALASPGQGPLALITFRPLALALDAARRPADAELEAAWKKAGQALKGLAPLARALGPELARWPGELLLGHYGGVRGLDAMKHADALATLGDPWPDIDDVATEVAFLGLEGAWEDRARALCRAELEQAHGRLRTIHRTAPARALHVGRVPPGGAAWDALGARPRDPWRPKTVAALDAEAFRGAVRALGGVGAAARALGCAVITVKRYALGERAVPADVAARCERVLVSRR